MSSFAEFRAAWDSFVTATALPFTWYGDPQPLVLKLPVRVELEGPSGLVSTGNDYIDYDDNGNDQLHAHRYTTMIVRAVSRDHVNSPAELTLERVRARLTRNDTRALLSVADISVLDVGPSVRYPTFTDGRKESVAAFEVRLWWRWDDEDLTGSADPGTIVEVSGSYEAQTDVNPEGLPSVPFGPIDDNYLYGEDWAQLTDEGGDRLEEDPDTTI